MNKQNFKEKDINLEKLLQKINKKEEIFWKEYLKDWDDENMANGLLLDDALNIMNLQKRAIQNLLAKMEILEESAEFY